MIIKCNGSGKMSVKDVLITGGTRNTGFVIAKTFAKAGYRLHITGRKLEEVKIAAEKIRSECPEAVIFSYSLEMSDVSDINRVFAEIKANAGKLDVFVANAANLGVDLDIYNTTEADFDGVMDVNVKGNFFCCQNTAKLMKDNGGRIVFLSSVQSKGAVEGRTVYSTSKAALNMMSKTLAYDLAPYKIQVNTLIVGAIHSDRWDVLDEETTANRRKAYPSGRESYPEEVANVVMYFAKDCPETVTGAELTIDSGVLLSILPYRDRKQFKRENF